MSKDEFLRQLEGLLSGISQEERADAMAFYRSYFEDAGEGNEAAIIEELESPEKVAESILKNLGIEGNGSYYNTYAKRDNEYYNNVNQTVNNLARDEKKPDNTTTIVLGVIVAILTSPIWLSVLAVAVSLLIALVAIVFAIAVAVVAVMAALLITGFVIMGAGFGCMFSGGVPVGIALVGAGILILALGWLAVVLGVWVFGVFLPWALKGIWKLCKMPFEKRKEHKAA